MEIDLISTINSKVKNFRISNRLLEKSRLYKIIFKFVNKGVSIILFLPYDKYYTSLNKELLSTIINSPSLITKIIRSSIFKFISVNDDELTLEDMNSSRYIVNDNIRDTTIYRNDMVSIKINNNALNIIPVERLLFTDEILNNIRYLVRHSHNIRENKMKNEYPPILSQGRDMLTYQALYLSNNDLYKLCQSSRILYDKICGNDTFWLMKVKNEYPDKVKEGEILFKANKSTWRNYYISLNLGYSKIYVSGEMGFGHLIPSLNLTRLSFKNRDIIRNKFSNPFAGFPLIDDPDEDYLDNIIPIKDILFLYTPGYNIRYTYIVSNNNIFTYKNNKLEHVPIKTLVNNETSIGDIISVNGGSISKTIYILTNQGLYAYGDNTHSQIIPRNDVRYNEFYYGIIKINHPINIIKISSGSSYVLFLTEEGYVYGMGSAVNGRLGIGDGNPFTPLTKLDLTFRAKEIFSGEGYSFIISENNDVYGFGYNIFGQLGLGQGSPRNILFPTKLEFPFTVKKIVCFNNTTIFLTNTDEIYACGKNEGANLPITFDNQFYMYDRMYNPTILDRIPDKENYTIRDVFIGPRTIFIITDDDEVYGFGDNKHGQLGLGHTNKVLSWVKIPVTFKVVKIAAPPYATIFMGI